MQVSIFGAPEFLPDPLDYYLPQNLFDEAVNNSQHEIHSPVGLHVSVEFGRGKGSREGIIVSEKQEIDDNSSFQIKQITSIISDIAVIDEEMIALYRKFSAYYGSTLAEMLPSIIPSRSVQAEKMLIKELDGNDIITLPFLHITKETEQLEHLQSYESIPHRASITLAPKLNNWAKFIAHSALNDIMQNRKVLICIPTDHLLDIFHSELEKAFHKSFPHNDLSQFSVNLSSKQTPKERYKNFLRCLYINSPFIAYGNKSACLAPFKADAIYFWQDNDANFKDMRSPYYNAREICLLREANVLRFVSYVPSFTVQRLVKIGYLESVTPTSDELRPICAKITALSSIYGEKLPSLAFSAIRDTIKSGRPVLIIYPRNGSVRLIDCKSCSEVAVCQKCDSALITNAKRIIHCPHCEEIYYNYHCKKCNSTQMKMAQIGSDEIAFQFEKMFPEVDIISSSTTAENGILRKANNNNAIYITTPGSEPIAKDGFGAVIIMDAQYWHAILSLEGTNDTLSKWFYAVSLLGDGAVDATQKQKNSKKVLLIGNVDNNYQDAMQRLDGIKVINRELQDRKERKLPPYYRVLCICGPDIITTELVKKFSGGEFDIKGPFMLNETSYYNFWRSLPNADNFICYIISTPMIGQNSHILASISAKIKILGHAGINLSDTTKISINQRNPVKFLLDPRALL